MVLPLRVYLRRLCLAPASGASLLWARRGRTEFFGEVTLATVDGDRLADASSGENNDMRTAF